MRAILKQYPVEGLKLQNIFPSRANDGYFGIIYPKNSPFKAAFDIGKYDSFHFLYCQFLVIPHVLHRLPTNGDQWPD